MYDGWKATDSAATRLGYNNAPPVRHDKAYRDTTTGFHTNDAESENHRLKRWSRHRYGKLSLDAAEMDEYIFYVNVGNDMQAVMKGLATANGGAVKNITV